jgi:hypothetical protein
MPNTSNYDFEYESPTSLPGTTLTGGPAGGSPILAQQVDSALASVETKVDVNTAGLATNTAAIAANTTALTNLQNWTRGGTSLISFTSMGTFTTPISFGFTFPVAPVVITNISSSGGSAARWKSRAVAATTTGFTLFLYVDPAGGSSTWTDVPVTWIAHYDG